MEKKTRIFTHLSVDIDAVASLWFLIRFVLKKPLKEVEIIFKPANWNGSEMTPDDFALDIGAGGRGIKGGKRGGRTASCFMSLFYKNSSSLSSDLRRILKSLGDFIDVHDSYGVDGWRKIQEDEDYHKKKDRIYFAGLLMVLNGYHVSNSDMDVCLKFFENLDNYVSLLMGNSREDIEKELVRVDYVGRVAIVDNSKIRINNKLFDQGFKAIVYIDGNSLGVLVKDHRLRADNQFVRKIVEDAGELIGDEDGWFAHPDGRLFCRGSRKSPVSDFSKVSPNALAEATNSYLLSLCR